MSNYLAGRAGRKTNIYLVNVIILCSSFVIVAPAAITRGLSLDNPSGLPTLVAVAALFTIAYVYFIQAMALGPSGVAAPISGAYAVVTLLTSLLFFGLAISGLMLAALVVVVGWCSAAVRQ